MLIIAQSKQVEAENQKLNSLAGASGEGRGIDTEATRRTLTELQEETQALRQQVGGFTLTNSLITLAGK